MGNSLAARTRLAPLLLDENIDCFLFDEQSKDIDVDALHRGFLRAARSTELVCGCEVRRANRNEGYWHLETTSGDFDCPIVVNAAGAWGDRLASLFGASPLGLTPKRRSACMVAAPEGVDIRQWPQIFPAREDFYCKPSGGQMMISPGDAIAVEPHDAFADDLALAEGIAAYERVVRHSVWRIEFELGWVTYIHPGRRAVCRLRSSAPGVLLAGGARRLRHSDVPCPVGTCSKHDPEIFPAALDIGSRP